MRLEIFMSQNAKRSTVIDIDDFEDFYQRHPTAQIELNTGERVPLEKVFPVFSQDEGSI